MRNATVARVVISLTSADTRPGTRIAPKEAHAMADQDYPIFEANDKKPEPYKAVRLYFADGSRQGGIWTGRVWWSEGKSVYPERWQLLPAADAGRRTG